MAASGTAHSNDKGVTIRFRDDEGETHHGIFESQRASGSVTYSYQNNMLFEDGGALTSKGGTFWAGNSTAPSWKVRGTSPSSCEAPIQVLGASILRVMTLDVADVTGNDQPDFIFRQSVKRHNDLPMSGINKTGIGTALMMGVFDLRNGLQVSCGTVMLGISNGWTGGAITLHGGTFAVSNNTVNAIPSVLKVSERGGTIQLGDGAKLSFLDSSGEAWAGDGILVVKNFAEGALRIGTTGDGLNDDQKGKIFWYDAQKNKNRPLRILGNGYLTAQIGMVISIH
ncbi:MAG: hypothetical protein IKF72_13315 [Kiritimatiellae bacterium]|nr:hypothetical protein [Kiritimatiellia bacterium]